MITLHITVDVKADRQVVLTLPPEVPEGQHHLEVSIPTPPVEKKTRPSLRKWAEENAENWGERINSENVEGFTGRS